MPSGSRSRRTVVRITPSLFRGMLELAPRRPSAVIYRGLPRMELVFNQPLTDEEKQKLLKDLREKFGDEFEVEVIDE